MIHGDPHLNPRLLPCKILVKCQLSTVHELLMDWTLIVTSLYLLCLVM